MLASGSSAHTALTKTNHKRNERIRELPKLPGANSKDSSDFMMPSLLAVVGNTFAIVDSRGIIATYKLINLKRSYVSISAF